LTSIKSTATERFYIQKDMATASQAGYLFSLI